MKHILAVVVAAMLAVGFLLSTATQADPIVPAEDSRGACEARAAAIYDADMAQADANFDSCSGFAYACWLEWVWAYAAAETNLHDRLEVCYYLPGAPQP